MSTSEAILIADTEVNDYIAIAAVSFAEYLPQAELIPLPGAPIKCHDFVFWQGLPVPVFSHSGTPLQHYPPSSALAENTGTTKGSVIILKSPMLGETQFVAIKVSSAPKSIMLSDLPEEYSKPMNSHWLQAAIACIPYDSYVIPLIQPDKLTKVL
ncbi:hypothetical protein OLMES_3781 [Oleiphilus messinensis]|uniref:CheW-like domain-containing protein n=1 Tax=Oleiphilus messinensis TaxID=141451 RepID=A0A1Y0IB99_9GAMM|nr:hypothetical protein [Oleiphilus messinensis]ARU57802.1 hypothetical protein OLMES_3781 [Oleiphilus messinensis]